MTKYKLIISNSFKKSYKKLKKRNYNMDLLNQVVTKLQNGNALTPSNKDHSLTGNWAGYRECHISPDWLLVYRIYNEDLILVLAKTGTHSDLDF